MRIYYKICRSIWSLIYKNKLTKVLDKCNTNDLAKIYCELNVYIIPDELKSLLKPMIFPDSLHKNLSVFAIVSDYVIGKIGEFEVNKYWNTEFRNASMTKEEHLDWWNNKRPYFESSLTHNKSREAQNKNLTK